MLFNSLAFLLLALPAAVALTAIVERIAPRWRVAWLVALSFAFYATFDLRFVPLLAASVVLNWLVARAFIRSGRAALVSLAIAANLALLGLYKYLDFAVGILDALPGVALEAPGWAFPLGISFFTFQHISYLADLRAGKAEPVPLLRYALYVAFFPRIVAGPLVRAHELFPQLDAVPGGDRAERLARGLLLLIAGLAKKVLIGDALAGLVDPVHAGIAAGRVPTVIEAWQAALGYAFQLYFDFAGYTDMALGIALMLGIVLPENFCAPYRATSIQDFWRRWHITLSLFLRDYLYIPFGGNRHGLPLQVLALFATMALGGLWHGAGWTFVAWGAAHGIALGLHLLWRKAGFAMPSALGWLLTFGFVVLAWVPFRAESFEAAFVLLRSLVGFAPLGRFADWSMILVAAALAVIGPTAYDLTRRLPPRIWVAVGAALLFAAVLVEVGSDANRDFIYARF
ncbi:MBOAT family O-acyltransferase [Enterovirga rhinocerotis]|uniref:Probable alginate O-acetylase AlgI n=1 Tax=Enterovirga rhinocerotis TaxID=1339210 RepID=A0A4R7BWT3_9HYPH|nr:MBOAT family O-acyltransferase [Enterovirga rhinocerotis]TDR89963.1 D-alanyl-lipoteichoic acid acyltransferase DltB (MBOAT superfamily) [Enterovirga rhinocerotis]